MSDVWNISNSDLLNLYQTDMEIDVMKRIIDTLPRAVDVWSMYRDREFRLKRINEYWAERLE
jgi:bifunctional pyridoxal-dependent enzyme with beta-cystathionase and maltose regulon repressor activities|tara:strand:- start:5103 stop:5288 length:186 start_codon:yes stop_codon:yes gene_type:complete